MPSSSTGLMECTRCASLTLLEVQNHCMSEPSGRYCLRFNLMTGLKTTSELSTSRNSPLVPFAVRLSFLRKLSRIRKHGYATSFGERIADAAGIAAPVFDHAGHFRAAIQLAGPVTRINKRTAKGFIPAVLLAAESNQNVVWKISICGSNRTYGRPWANGDQNLNLSGIRKIEIDQGLRSAMGSLSSTTRTHAIFPTWMSLDGRSEMVSG